MLEEAELAELVVVLLLPHLKVVGGASERLGWESPVTGRDEGAEV